MEKSTFLEVFGDSPFIRALDFFLTFSEFDYSIKQIAKEVGAGWITVEIIIKKLLAKKIIKETREVGKAKMYMLNKENPIAKYLLKIDFEIARIAAEKELNRQKIPIRA